MIDFGKSLRAVQTIQGVRSVELASRFGVHAQQIHRWRYQKTGSLALIHKICKDLTPQFDLPRTCTCNVALNPSFFFH